ncbi:MAG: apolipoprotein N-acyltransferase [Betaproteobacteria bacterium]|nr:apolipoprotein N-acyltransferase [Betaproteobacteria bacterium]
MLSAFAAGAISVAAFSVPQYFALAPAALALLYYLWQRADSPRRAAALGFAFGLGHFGTGVSWIYVSLHEFGMMPAPLAAAATLAFCCYLALFPALVGSLQARIGASPPLRFLVLVPALWTLAEWLRSWLLTGFPWLSVGYSQIDTPLAGFAPIAGMFGVSFATCLLSGLALLVLGAGRARVPAVAAIVLLVAAGQGLRAIEWTRPVAEPVRVALVQGNIPQSLKFDPRRYAVTLDTYRRLVLASDAQLVVLPETAIPRFLDAVDPRYLAELAHHAGSRGADILLGVPLREPGGRMTNGVVTLGASPPQRYSKVHLVPLGEFVPPEFGWIVSVLRIPLADFDSGSDLQQPLEAGGARVAVNICYEDAFGEEIIRQLPKATLLVNVSNVAWFGDSLAPAQHLQISRMRALETGRAMLRATNTGVTAIIDQRGTVIGRLPGFAEGVLTGAVQQFTGATPYVRLGNVPALATAALLVLWIVCLSFWRGIGRRVSARVESR